MEADITKNILVCQSKIRTFEWITDLVTRNQSHKKWWTATNSVRYTDEEKELYKLKREEIKEEIYRNLAINIGNPGDMVTDKALLSFPQIPLGSSMSHWCRRTLGKTLILSYLDSVQR